MTETPTVTLEQLIPQDSNQDDRVYHKTIRSLAEQPIEKPNDKDLHKKNSGRWSKGLNPGKRQAQTELPMKYNSWFTRPYPKQ
jgi:hypothetical protein